MKKNKRSLILILSSVVFLLFLCVGTLLTPGYRIFGERKPLSAEEAGLYGCECAERAF